MVHLFFLIKAFSIFTGLGIHNCQMYENACRLMAKQTVALEVLSYHATAQQDETDKLVVSPSETQSTKYFVILIKTCEEKTRIKPIKFSLIYTDMLLICSNYFIVVLICYSQVSFQQVKRLDFIHLSLMTFHWMNLRQSNALSQCSLRLIF